MSRMAVFTDGPAPLDRTNWHYSYLSYYVHGAALGLGLDLALRTRWRSALSSVFDVRVRRGRGARLSFRRPSWASSVSVRLNGAPVSPADVDGVVPLPRAPRDGDHVELAFEHRLVVETRDGRHLPPSSLGAEPVEGLLRVGPLLYVVDDGTEPLFFGEPWLGANVVSLKDAALDSAAGRPATAARSWRFSRPERALVARYEHGGFVGTHPVTLRPVGEQASREPGIVAAWLKYRG
jgi:DUF1680 family protein